MKGPTPPNHARAGLRVRAARAAGLLGLAAALTLSACSDSPRATTPDEPTAPQAANVPANVFEVQDRYTPALMKRQGIIGTGVRLAADGPAIVVYAVRPDAPGLANLPSHLEGHPLAAVVTGRIDAGDINNPTTRERPAPNGFSVGHPNITAGTIGARVVDASGRVYILSNNHVLADVNAASIGDPAYQPGPYDGGTSADRIATLTDFEPILLDGSENVMDAAIAEADNGADLLGVTPSYAYGAPSSTVYSGNLLGVGVQKFGRTTGHTTGTVEEVNVTVQVCYVPRGMFSCAEAGLFVDQIGITPGDFSAGGDSGSLIVTNDANKHLVGLLFAGSSARTLANPIQPVLDRFGVSIDTSNDGGTGDGGGDGGGDGTDAAPTASFSYSCSRETCSFSDGSTDDNGVVSWSWSFGDGGTSSAQNPSHAYGSAGSYTVDLTVTDGAGQSSSASNSITCEVKGRWLRCS